VLQLRVIAGRKHRFPMVKTIGYYIGRADGTLKSQA
jgi:hypothetical protein